MENAKVWIDVKNVRVNVMGLPFNPFVPSLSEDARKPAPNPEGMLTISVIYDQHEDDDGIFYSSLYFEGAEAGDEVTCFEAIESPDLVTLADFLDVARTAAEVGGQSVALEQVIDIAPEWLKVDCGEREGDAFIILTVAVACRRDGKPAVVPIKYFLTPQQATLLAAACRTVAGIARRDEGSPF